MENIIPRSSNRTNRVLTKGNTARPISMIESHQIITLNNIPPSYCSKQKHILKYITESADFTYKTKKPCPWQICRKAGVNVFKILSQLVLYNLPLLCYTNYTDSSVLKLRLQLIFKRRRHDYGKMGMFSLWLCT